METIKIEGQLEIDSKRGVIYFHANDAGLAQHGWTVLRICRLPIPIPNPISGGLVRMIDISHMFGTSYHNQKED